uniref:Ig-like domain-containing protein n=1 Tax=Amphilophus citrinellus TaxID=61819 RepID=A0A3Q0R4B8_AMPCI
MITVRCAIYGDGSIEWEYEWSKPDSDAVLTNNECHTQPVLTVSPSWLSPGASVTLNCEVKHPSAGWSFYWYKAVSQMSNIYELLPGSISGTEKDSYIIDGQTHTAGYVCRAGRGDPEYHTDHSETKFVWSAGWFVSASLTVSPNRVQHLIYESVSLTCSVNSSSWRVMRFDEHGYLSQLPDCPNWRTMTRSTCNIERHRHRAAVYWCETESGEFSNGVNITLHGTHAILVSPVHPVSEGDSVTLGCKLWAGNLNSTVAFYKNMKLIQKDDRQNLNISAVSKSDEGFYKCEYSGHQSQESWMSVKGKSSRSSLSLSLITGLVCGISLILLLPLLLVCWYRKSKGEIFTSIIYFIYLFN